MKYEFQVRMQQRHLNAIVGALRFRQRFLAGDVYGTIGRAAMEAWRVLPDVAHGAYPERRGEKGVVQSEVLKSCRAIEDIVWRQKPPALAFSASQDGRLAAELLSQNKTKERHTRFIVKLRKGGLRKIGWAVEFGFIGDRPLVTRISASTREIFCNPARRSSCRLRQLSRRFGIIHCVPKRREQDD